MGLEKTEQTMKFLFNGLRKRVEAIEDEEVRTRIMTMLSQANAEVDELLTDAKLYKWALDGVEEKVEAQEIIIDHLQQKVDSLQTELNDGEGDGEGKWNKLEDWLNDPEEEDPNSGNNDQ